MDDIPNYNFLQAIDPTKIKVPISERFAKLTLSSNKKKQEKCEEEHEQQQEINKLHEKRASVTRNISKQFDDEKENKQVEQNPLLRSESSNEAEECNNSVETNTDTEDLTMEPLEISEDKNEEPQQMDDELEMLSQQIGLLAVQPKPISLSSSSTGNLSINTDWISSESQYSSASDVDKIHIVHNIPINIREAVKQDTIALNLTSSDKDVDKTYEMTDDEDEESQEEEEEVAITISDTSGSHQEPEHDIMATSSVPCTSIASDNLSLPSLVDDKAERVAAFLRDVSLERQAMAEQGVIYNDTVDQILDKKEINEIEQALAKSRQIATADTESMTPDIDEEATPKPVLKREQRLRAVEMFGGKEKDANENSTLDKENKLNTSINKNNQHFDVHRLANNDTLENTIMTEAEVYNNEQTPKTSSNSKTPVRSECKTDRSVCEETPKNSKKVKVQKQLNLKNSRHLSYTETEDNNEFALTEDNISPIKVTDMDPRRLVNDDTMPNSTAYDIENAQTQQSDICNNDQAQQSPENVDNKHDSISSIVSSASDFNGTIPEHSITILETDDESIAQKSPEKIETSDNNKLSNSFHKDDSSDDSEYDGKISQMQMSMPNINISAKINIKIRFPNNSTSTDTSEDEQNHKTDTQDSKKKTKNSNPPQFVQTENERQSVVNRKQSVVSNETNMDLDSPQILRNQMQQKDSIQEIIPLANKPLDSIENVDNEKFLTEAEKLLTQLYGKSWQTPDVMRTLKRTCHSGNISKSSSQKKIDFEDSKENKSNNKTAVEDSILDDFSMFRRNIVKTNLDSTRLAARNIARQNKEVFTEPKSRRKPSTPKEKINAKIRMPQTIASNKGRGRWQHLIDDDGSSESNNASDDSDADDSWSKNASELENDSGSDFENSPVNKTRKGKNTSKTRGRSDKSDYLTKILNKSEEGEIVYLDLTKDEVEVQDEVPESPPVNHDVTFASRLQEILKTCRHEGKTKLPSSTKKTKRKLFTPKFGDDDFEVVLPKEMEANLKENTNKIIDNEDEILEDCGNCPFDSQGRPKVLNLFNKQLESVKTGKPIFQLTPSPKKKGIDTKSINKTKSEKPSIFKTPLTTKFKGPPKSVNELCQTPDYKYGFLKSLDVTVSKSFCHPDALYYRDNYRTKKEDLSRILYEMYNEKLFKNQLDVPLKWNKKLLNTAGRCLNKKRLGVRSSVIELSDKVLTSADRLRCTLIHELCHAATWIFNGEGGHGSCWKEWARRANATFPEIPKIGVCHQYDIEYTYTYKCTLCGAKSNAHSKSKKVENIRCSYCHGAIEIFLNKKDKDGNVLPTPVKEPTGFAKFVKDNYKKFKRDDLKHADVMKLLSSEFASIKVTSN